MNLVTLTSDFAVQSQGVGLMELMVRSIARNATVVHLMHGLPAYSLVAAARTLEALQYSPVGIHVCVCDPGVGTARRALACQVGRGDYLIGPDNGVLIPAARLLGGFTATHEISEQRYMNAIISPLFHGRDVFAPAAAHIANGTTLEQLGATLDSETLCDAPYEEASWESGTIAATVIQVNKFGSLHLNISHDTWDAADLTLGTQLEIEFGGQVIALPFGRTFDDVEPDGHIIMRDDYGRVEIATNMGNFAARYALSIGDLLLVRVPA